VLLEEGGSVFHELKGFRLSVVDYFQRGLFFVELEDEKSTVCV
jgi:hypothetical protein